MRLLLRGQSHLLCLVIAIKKYKISTCISIGKYDILSLSWTFGCGAAVAQLTVNQLVTGSNPVTRAI